MKQKLLSVLRDKNTVHSAFRSAADRLGEILAIECAVYLDRVSVDLRTPLAATVGTEFSNDIVLVPVLRAGLALLHPFLRFYPDSRVGFIGLKRDEQTAKSAMYYRNLPSIEKNAKVIILEPMIATGGSISLAIREILNLGVQENQIIVASIVGSVEGVEALKKAAPEAHLHIIQIDSGINDKSYIVPGLGDFGDRYFAAEDLAEGFDVP